jgi:hypothetical protein
MSDGPTRAFGLVGILTFVVSGGAIAGEEAGTPATAVPDAGASDAPPAKGAEPGSPSAAPEASESGGLFEQSQSAAAATAAPGADAFKLSGYVRGDVYAGKVTGQSKGEMKASYGEAALIARTKKGTYGDGFAELRLLYGMQSDPQQQAVMDVREAYVNTYLGPVDLRLGKQIIVWGRADLLNPTANLTPNDLHVRSPIEDDRRIGNIAARANLRLAPVRIEGVWIPTYSPTVLPPLDLPQYVYYSDPNFPKPDLGKGLLAGRVHLELPAFEMSVSYLHGYAPLPGLTYVPQSVTFSSTNPSVLIVRNAYKQQVVGFDFSTSIGDLVALRGEAAYRKPYDYEKYPYAPVPKPDVQYVLGGDHTFGSVSVIAQYLGRYTFHWEKEPGPLSPVNPSDLKTDTPSVSKQLAEESINLLLAKDNQILFSQTAKLQHLATVRIEYLLLHDTLSLSALGLVNFTTKEWLAAPKIGYHLSDSLVAYVGAEILTGPRDTLFGMVDQKMSAGYAELRSTF